MSDVATFLSLVLPWGQPGYLSIHGPFTLPDGTTVMPGRAFTDLNAAVRYVMARRQHCDLFICASAQAQAAPHVNRHGKRTLKAMRHAEQALWLRCWYLDVDIKHGFFRDTAHALEVFGLWRQAVGLPPPTLIVLTGSGGFHAYWVVDTPVPRETWQPLADALANAAGSLKPMPDPDTGKERRLDIGLTTNPACLLRIPDTLNFKHSPPIASSLAHVGETFPLAVLDAALAPYKGTYSPARLAKPMTKAAAAFAGMPTPTPLTAGLEDRWRPTSEEVVEVCPWFARVLHTSGAGCAEPEWYTSLQVAYFCQQGSELAHRLSNGHASYTQEGTDRKFAQVESTHASGKLGWPQCRTIHLNGAPECRTCPHHDAGKSPLNFISSAPAEPTEPSAIIVARTGKVKQPEPFRQDDEGLIWKDPDGDKPSQLVCDYPILNFVSEAPQSDGSGRFQVSFETYIDATRFKLVVVPYDFLAEPRQFALCLSKQGMMPRGQQRTLLRDYMESFVSLLRRMKASSGNSEPFGWSVDENGKRTAFIVGPTKYNCAGLSRVAPLDRTLAEHYQPKGSIEVFKKCAELIIQQERYDLITLMMTSVGAVLTPMTGIGGLVVHAYGPGGRGKSHVMRTSQAMWSNPVKEQSMLDDTGNYLIGKMATLRNMPLYYDDVKGKDATIEMLKLIYGATMGRSKGRMTQASELRPVHDFCTMLVIASNNSLFDYINDQEKTGTAGLDRVFEIPIADHHGVGRVEGGEPQRAMGELSTNYGQAGVIYASYLGQNIPAIEKAVHDTQDMLIRMTDAKDQERFWIGTMTCCYVGAHIGNKLGLFGIDERKLLEFQLGNFYRLRDRVGSSPTDISKPESVERIVQHYIGEHTRFLLVTDTVPAGAGRPVLITPNGEFRDGVRIRYATKQKLLRFSKFHFCSWLRNAYKVRPHEIVAAIMKLLPAREDRISLVNGTRLTGGREEIIEISNWVHMEE